MKKRGLIISVLVLLAVITSGFTYAFWANSVNGLTGVDRPGSVTIGTGEDVTVNVTIGNSNDADGDVLVPTTITPLAGQTTKVTFTYLVTWVSDDRIESVTTANIVVTQSTILVGGVENPYGLIQVSLTNPGTVTQGSATTLTFEVTMTEPASQAQYTAVAGKEITFTLTFAINPIVA